jgi:hypothetical protein
MHANALEKLQRLQAIVVDRLPKTVDGVPLTPHDTVWTWFGNGPVEAVTLQYRPLSLVYPQCYSTREAAEQARAAK